MIAFDTNLPVHAHRRDAPFHAAAAACVARPAEGSAPWAIPWPCLHEFLAVVTHPRIFKQPTPLDAALDQVDAWLESPTLVQLSETREHWTRLRSLLCDGRVAGLAVQDARVAALCLQHGVRELWTADRGFGRFPALRCVNPLIEG